MVAEWRGHRPLLLRHGHMFARKGPRLVTVRYPLICLPFSVLQYTSNQFL